MMLQHNADLTPFNTFGLSARAAALCTLEDENRLPEIFRQPEYRQDTVLWLGGGSNVLFCADYIGLVVRMATKGISHQFIDEQNVRVEAQAGEIWHDFVQYTVSQGFSGLENLSLIPGTVGAAPVQNIGAYGVEVGSRIEAVRCFDLVSKKEVVFSHGDCCFAYRDSLFKQAGKGRYVILSVRFVLSRQFVPRLGYGDLKTVAETLSQGKLLTAAAVAEAVCQIRRTKLPDPRLLGNAGSFFKNPITNATTAAALAARYPNLPQYPQANGQVKLAAGWLIDYCGLKGFQIGGAAVHEKQALVLVNKNHATAADVVALSRHIQDAVQQKFGVFLETEPIWLPEKSTAACLERQ